MTTPLYSSRSAKRVQRRMVVDACRRLSALVSLNQYQYVGFGGLEFNDFRDAHNALGITSMTSIERNEALIHRLEFNKPYAKTQILIGEARDRLPDIDWRIPSIVWLDYMDPLNRSILRDIEYVVRAAQPGSFLIVTVQAGLGDGLSGRLAAINENLDDLAPPGLTTEDVKGWGVADIQQSVLSAQAAVYCDEAHGSPIRQVLDIGYQDTIKMTTWAGVVSSPTTERAIDSCRFEDLPFVRSNGMAGLRIKVPEFTDKEWSFLEHEIGNGKRDGYERPKGLERTDIEAFQEVYRYRVV